MNEEMYTVLALQGGHRFRVHRKSLVSPRSGTGSGSGGNLVRPGETTATPRGSTLQRTLVVPQQVVGSLLGKHGAILQALQASTGTRIEIQEEHPTLSADERLVVVSVEGAVEDGAATDKVENAVRKVQVMVRVAKERLGYNHFLSLPLQQQQLGAKVQQFYQRVRELHVDGFDESLLIPPPRLHLTLTMLRIYGQTERNRLVACMQQWASSVVKDVLQEKPLVLRVGGVAVLKSTPDNAHILYAKVQAAEEGDSRLETLIQWLLDQLAREQLLPEKENTFPKLHMTLMNTNYRKGKAKRETPREQGFDARQVLLQLGDFDFGNVPLESVQQNNPIIRLPAFPCQPVDSGSIKICRLVAAAAAAQQRMPPRRKTVHGQQVPQQSSPVTAKPSTMRKSIAGGLGVEKENQLPPNSRTQQQQQFMDSPQTLKPMSSVTTKSATNNSIRPNPAAPQLQKNNRMLKLEEFDLEAIQQHRKSIAFRRQSSSATGSLRRRSSFSLRGKRKSSFGELQTSIHADIPSEQFYRHISPDLPDPVRLRQLFIYAFQRELEGVDANTEQDEVQLAATSVMENILQQLVTKKINTSWYHRERENLPLVTQPNPENGQNQLLLEGYRQTLQRYKAESEEWERVLSQYEEMTQKMAQEQSNAATLNLSDTVTSLDLREMLALDVQQGPQGLRAQDCVEMQEQAKQLSATLAQLDNSLHRLEVLAQSTDRYAERRFTDLIDVCWPGQEEQQELDQETVEATKLRLQATKKAFFEDWQKDKTMDLLRVLATAITEEEKSGEAEKSSQQETAVLDDPMDLE